jgi:hypothetical protein
LSTTTLSCGPPGWADPSPCGTYRYLLGRQVEPDAKTMDANCPPPEAAAPSVEVFAGGVRPVEACRWSGGAWRFGDGVTCGGNGIHDTGRDARLLGDDRIGRCLEVAGRRPHHRAAAVAERAATVGAA